MQYYMYLFTLCDVIICMRCTLLMYVLFVNQEMIYFIDFNVLPMSIMMVILSICPIVHCESEKKTHDIFRS